MNTKTTTPAAKVTCVDNVYYNQVATAAEWDCEMADGSLLTMTADVGYDDRDQFEVINAAITKATDENGDDLDITDFSADDLLNQCVTMRADMFDRHWVAIKDYMRY